MTDYYLYDDDGDDGDSGLTWALAKATLAGVIAVGLTSADRVFVKKAHLESLGGSTNYVFPENPGFQWIIVATATTNEPPVNSDLAQMTEITEGWVTSGNFAINLNGSSFAHGFSLVPSNVANNSGAEVTIGSSTSQQTDCVFESCTFGTRSTNAGANLFLGANADSIRLRLTDCTYHFGAVTQEILVKSHVLIQNLGHTGSTPTSLFKGVASDSHGHAVIENSDINAIGPTNLLERVSDSGTQLEFRNCKLPAGVTLVTGSVDRWSADSVEVFNSDSADTNYRYAFDGPMGTIDTETTIVRTGGAEHGGTQYSFKMVSTANSVFAMPLETPEFVIWNETVGSPITVTVQATGSELPQTDD
ncbi:hypothetical protein LCGC14_2716920, partial [marine sediment metagenome]